jgi:CHASE2 domain-containing sensor protein
MVAEQLTRPPRDRKALLQLLAGAAAVWFLLGLDPFGLGAATQLASERIALRLMAPLYFNENPAVTVVLIDDDYLDEAGRSWPLSYAEQGKLARTLLTYRPDTLFLDIVYRHPHGAGDDPEDLLRSLRARRPVRGRPTPVLIAAFAPAAIDPLDSAECLSARPFLTQQDGREHDRLSGEAIGVIPELANSDVVTRAYVGWQRCGSRYPLLVGGDPAIATPAFALYQAHCNAPDPSPYSACVLNQRFRKAQALGSFGRTFDPMTVLWGAFPTAAQSRLYAAGECQRAAPDSAAPSLPTRLSVMLRQAYRSLVGDVEQAADPDVRLPCPAVDVLRASQIPEGYSPQISPFLENRVVLVGSYLDGLPDLYSSPVNGQVSGVVAHATALDNLMTKDQRYISDLPGIYSKVLEVLVLVAAVFLIWRLQLPDTLKTRATGLFSLCVWALLALVAVTLGEWSLALKLLGVGIVMDWFKPKAAAEVAVLSCTGAMLALVLFQLGFVAFNWINIVLSAWGTAELVKSVQRDKAKKEEVEKISVLRLLRQKLRPAAA